MFFLWCHIRHLNLVERNPQRITRKDRELVNKLGCEGINFPVSRKDYCRIEMQDKICINVFCYDNKLTYPVYLSGQKFNDNIDLLLVSNEFKSHYVYIKDFDRFMFHKTKNRNRKHFCKCCLQVFSSKEIPIEHKKNCLVINGKQSVKLKSSSVRFKNYSKQIPVPFKIYADFECILKKVDCDIIECNSIECNSNISYTRKNQDHIPCSFTYKVVCTDNKFSKKVVLCRGKNVVNKFIKSILSEYNYRRKVVKKHFSKNLIMSAEEEERFQLSNICWICNKLFDVSGTKVRDHCHVTGKYRGTAHWSCKVIFKVTKKVPLIFHNLKGYDSHLIFKELSKCNVKISIITNGLEKYMAFTIKRNLVCIDSMQFVKLSLDLLVKNLMSEDFKYLSEEFSGEYLRLVKEKGIYPYEYMDSFKRFSEDKLPDKCIFF